MISYLSRHLDTMKTSFSHQNSSLIKPVKILP